MTVFSIYLVVRFAVKASESQRDADEARKVLSARERFNERMRQPLATGANLVRDLRARIGVPKRGGGKPPGVPIDKRRDD